MSRNNLAVFKLKRWWYRLLTKRVYDRCINSLIRTPTREYTEVYDRLNCRKWPFGFEQPSYWDDRGSERAHNLAIRLMDRILLCLGERESLRAHHIKLHEKGKISYRELEGFEDWFDTSVGSKMVALRKSI